MAAPQKFRVHLTPEQQEYLTDLARRSTHPARVLNRVRALLLAHSGKTNAAVREVLGLSLPTIIRIRCTFCTQGLEQALTEAPRPGRPHKFDGKDRAAITSLACTAAPKGHARWSLRLLADRAVELQIVEDIAHTSIFYMLKKTKLPRTAKASGASPA